MREMDELRGLTAGRLLELWRETRDIKDPLERVLLCNVRILMEACRFQGKRVYGSEDEALADLTGREMERLLRRLSEGGGAPGPEMEAEAKNPGFDPARFRVLEGA